MKLFTTILAAATLAAEPAASTKKDSSSPLQLVSEKAEFARKEALAIDGLLKSKQVDFAALATRAATLDGHIAEMHQAVLNLESGSPAAQHLRASVEVLKVLTGNKVTTMESADAGDRGRMRASAKNIAMRAESILKTAKKIGG